MGKEMEGRMGEYLKEERKLGVKLEKRERAGGETGWYVPAIASGQPTGRPHDLPPNKLPYQCPTVLSRHR